MPGPSYIANAQQNRGLYVPTTNVWDQSQLQDINVNSDEFKLLLVRLYQNINSIALALNLKDSALYDLQEFVNGQMFFSNTPMDPTKLRNDFRLVMNVGAIVAGVNTFAHNLPVIASWTWTRIYATATDSVGLFGYPIGTGGAAAGIATIFVNATNVVITNNTGVNFTRCIVVLEYLKN